MACFILIMISLLSDGTLKHHHSNSRWPMKIGNFLLIICIVLTGCSSNISDEKQTISGEIPTKPDLVKYNAKIALEQCGRDNVREVTTKGFTCHN